MYASGLGSAVSGAPSYLSDPDIYLRELLLHKSAQYREHAASLATAVACSQTRTCLALGTLRAPRHTGLADVHVPESRAQSRCRCAVGSAGCETEFCADYVALRVGWEVRNASLRHATRHTGSKGDAEMTFASPGTYPGKSNGYVPT